MTTEFRTMTAETKDELLACEHETPSVFEMMWDSAMTFFKCVGIFAVICFALGYISTKQAQAKQCEPTKVVLARSIFK
jgi:hypothetical protein